MNNLNEKCAVFGIYGSKTAAKDAYFGLFALQHRGQEHSGIATTDGEKIFLHKNSGLVSQVFSEEILAELPGFAAIGHNRYSTSSGLGVEHAQPFIQNGEFAFAHNGNLPSVKALQDFLKENREDVNNHYDSELMSQAIAVYLKQGKTLPEAVKSAFPLFTGAFSSVVLGKNMLIGLRDQCGIRPLAIGKRGDEIVIASESCALNTLGAEFVREVNPGEMVVITKDGMESIQVVEPNPKLDIFEFVYFARYDSIISGKSVYEVRKNLGRNLAREHKLDVDMVIPVPETAVSAAIGYSEEAGVPFEMGISKNRYINRTFIEPTQELRQEKIKMKLSPLVEVIKGKRIAVVDDSIVRGNTSRQLVKMLYEAGAKEVHFLVSSPPIRFPDFYGIDTPDQKELIASKKTIREICEFLGANSLSFLSIEGMVASTGMNRNEFSMPSFDGVYPIDIHERKNEINYDVPKE